MMHVRSRLLHISRCRGVNRRIIRSFFRYDPSLKTIYTLSSSRLSEMFHLSNEQASRFKHDLNSQSLISEIKSDLTAFKAVTIVDDSYPSILKAIKDAPLVLYMLGDHTLLEHTPALSVIGTRHPSTEAAAKVKRIVGPLVESGWMIVSGMAKGVDGLAHTASLNGQGKTIAVLGSGFHHIYPRNHQSLFESIRTSGLLISEYPPATLPQKHHFPERNRIISGLSVGTLVIEATQRSGTLITVDQALDQGRDVYAVPGSPFVKQTIGCHKMIQEGAKLVFTSEDILEDWNETTLRLFYEINRYG